MDKKACRASAAAYPALDTRHGLLHAAQVDYIVRTAVKNIDHRRTLVLYVYDRQQAAAGSCAPVWTVFQVKDDYITLARREDGTTAWRTASFERLGNEYYLVSKCAFYSAADCDRVTRFFHDGQWEGLTALTHAQDEILERRLRQRLRQRERAVMRRMEHLPALPRNLGGWLRREVVPAYFVYAHARKGEAAGVCTACGREITLTSVRHNAKLVCPLCGREFTMKPGGRIGKLQDRVTAQVVQKTRTGELVVRIIKVIASVSNISIWENARQFIRLDAEGRVVCDAYYETVDGHWKRGERPVFYPYSYNFYADTCGHVYTANLPRVLAGTPWQYCPVQMYYEHFREPMQLAPFLRAYFGHPRLEHLIKAGFFDLASDLVYRYIPTVLLDESQACTHRILGVAAEDVNFLRKMGIGSNELDTFQKYASVKDRQNLLRWQMERQVSRDVLPILYHVTAHKLMKYVDAQYARLCPPDKKGRYSEPQSVVTEYRDYLDMCARLDYAVKSKSVLFPKDLRKAHDQAAEQVKLRKDELARRNFEQAYERIMHRLDFVQDGLKIVCPQSLEELAAEGNALHHCVGSYADRVARKECLILFLRRCSEPERPFYTMEVRDGHITQLRGLQNCGATPEVQRFADDWERQVLRGRKYKAA